MNNLLLVSLNAVFNLVVNGISYLIVARHLENQELAKYLHLMALIPVLGTISASFQQITSHNTNLGNSVRKLYFVSFCVRKSLPFSITVLLLIILFNEEGYNSDITTLLLVASYLPLGFVISGLIGILQRENLNLAWQVISAMESVIRLASITLISKFFSTGISMYSAILIGIILSTIILVSAINKNLFKINLDMKQSTHVSTLKLVSFSVLVQADVLLAPILLGKDESFSYMFLSNLVKLLYGIVFVFSQMSFSSFANKSRQNFSIHHHPQVVIFSVWIAAALFINLFPFVPNHLIEIVLQKPYIFDKSLLNLLLIGNCVLSLCNIPTFQRIKMKKRVMGFVLISLSIFVLTSLTVFQGKIPYACAYLTGILFYFVSIRVKSAR